MELAELYVSVQPDTSKFGHRLVRDLERKYRNRAIEIAVRPNTRKFASEARRAASTAGRAAGRDYSDAFNRSSGGISRSLRSGTRSITGLATGAISSAAKVAAVGIGAATAATAIGLAKATSKAGAFDKTMRMAAQTMHAGSGEMKGLTDLAVEMGAKTSFSAQGAADAMLALAKGGLRPAQIQAGVLNDTLTLATAGGLELGDAADYMVRGLGAFHLKARDAGRVSSALAGAANASTGSVESMGLALQQASASAASAGLSIEETTAALAAFDNAGVRGSDAGTSLKTMLARLTPNTDKQSAAFKKLGLITSDGQNRFFKANGEMRSMQEIAGVLEGAFGDLSTKQRIQAMNTVFGSDATRAATILMNEGREGIAKYQKATEDRAAAEKLAKTATQGYAGAMERFKGTLETVQIIAGGEFLPGVTSGLNSISGWLERHQDDLRSVFKVAAGAAQDFGRQVVGVASAFSTAFMGPNADFHSFTTNLINSQVDITRWGSTVIGTFVASAHTVSGFTSAVLDGLATIDESAASTMDFFIPWMKIMKTIAAYTGNVIGAKMWDDLIKGSEGQSAAFRNSAASTRALSDGLKNRLNPALEAARTKAKELAAQAVVRAGQRQAADNVAAAINRIGKSGDFAKKGLKGYDIESGKGNAVQKAFAGRVHDARRALIGQYQAAVEARVGHKAFNKIVADGREKLYREFLQMGYSKAEAKRLATQYSRVPKKIETQVKQPGMAGAKSDTKSLDERINALNDKKVKIMVALGKQGFSRQGLQETVDRRVKDGGRLADGGKLQGPGTGRSDSILGVNDHGMPLARVSTGEWVINAKSSEKYDDVLKRINEDKLAAGGKVARKITTTTTHPSKEMRQIPGQADALANAMAVRVWKAYQDVVGGGVGHGSKKRVRWHGGTFTERFANTLKSAQRIDHKYFPVIQGGFRPRTSYSGSSHAGDAVDTVWNSGRLSAMHRAGVYAWHRTPAQGPWGHHIHGIPKKGFGYPAGSGKWQQGDAARGGNGLKVGGTIQQAGWAKVGERGPELIQGNKGDKVTPLNQPISIQLNLGDDLTYFVQGLIDDDNNFKQSIGKLSR